MVTGFVQSLIKICRLDWSAPDYSTLVVDKSILTLRLAITKVAMVSLAQYIAHYKFYWFPGEGEWKRKKHQPEYHHQWRINFISA